MLRNVGIRTKLLAVLAIPTVLLLLATTLLVGAQVGAAREAGQVNALTDVAVKVNLLVHGLQQERRATLQFLQDGTQTTTHRMRSQRLLVDRELGELRASVAGSPLTEISAAVATAATRSARAHARLAAARGSIDNQTSSAAEAGAFYGKVIQTDLALPGAVAESGSPELAARLRAYGVLSATIEYAAHERDLLEISYLRGKLLTPDYAELVALGVQQDQALTQFAQVAPTVLATSLARTLDRADNAGVELGRRHALDLLTGTKPDAAGALIWVGAASTRIGPMVRSEANLVQDIATTAATTQSDQTRRAYLLSAIALLGLALAIALAVALARRIARPLQRLTAAAGHIGAELPAMVERMQTPGAAPDAGLEPIPVESRDEIGRLALAFNTVNEVTVRVAQEQAALRAGIAEMFVNVARRNQVLLGRQLTQIDQMERHEENPDVLERLFKLDHLATRMRRNAESLLVLAGLDATRRLRHAMPLSDVIRTAVSEIEAYDRVDLALPTDPDVAGRLALTTAHLLAELLENATHFSNPDTRVAVSAVVTANGVDVSVTDLGLGMSEEELAEANQHIAAPPVGDIAVSQRLGLYVVGRLAARLGAAVVLGSGHGGGIVVTVSLPATVFEGLATVEPLVEPTVDPPVDALVDPPVDALVELTVDPPVDALVEPTVDPTVDALVDPPVDALVDPPVDPPVDPRSMPRSIRRSTQPSTRPVLTCSANPLPRRSPASGSPSLLP